MAVTNQDSTQLGLLESTAIQKVLATHELHGRVRFAFFEHTQDGAGDANSTVRMVRLPPGKIRLILPLSRVAFSAFGASRTMDLGWEAYTNEDGTAVVADEDGLDAAVDVSSAGSVNPGGTIGTHETKLFDNRDGVVLVAKVEAGTIPDAATLDGYFVYVQD